MTRDYPRLLDDLLRTLEPTIPSDISGLSPANLNRLSADLTGSLLQHLFAQPERPVDAPRHPIERARAVVWEEFLAASELDALTQHVLARRSVFNASQVIRRDLGGGRIDHDHRRSQVLFDLGIFQPLIADRVLAALPAVLTQFERPPFPVSKVEAQITVSNHGDYFRVHNDNTHVLLERRELTYVYFFHREPRAFAGGELRIYDSYFENGRYVAGAEFITVVPECNQVVFFPSFFMHEIRPVHCPSNAFEDGRFTINGWIHRG